MLGVRLVSLWAAVAGCCCGRVAVTGEWGGGGSERALFVYTREWGGALFVYTPRAGGGGALFVRERGVEGWGSPVCVYLESGGGAREPCLSIPSDPCFTLWQIQSVGSPVCSRRSKVSVVTSVVRSPPRKRAPRPRWPPSPGG